MFDPVRPAVVDDVRDLEPRDFSSAALHHAAVVRSKQHKAQVGLVSARAVRSGVWVVPGDRVDRRRSRGALEPPLPQANNEQRDYR
jgi:hypothetical protein